MIRSRRMRVLGLASPLLVAMLAAVCTPNTTVRPEPVASPRVLGTSVAREALPRPALQACTLLTVTEVERVTARAVTAAVPDPDAIGCTWSLSGGGSVVLTSIAPDVTPRVQVLIEDDARALSAEEELSVLARRRMG